MREQALHISEERVFQGGGRRGMEQREGGGDRKEASGPWARSCGTGLAGRGPQLYSNQIGGMRPGE